MARKQLIEEKKPAPPQASQAPAGAPKVSFDAWWALTAKNMPNGHHREIILADFRARGLSMNETMAAYNEALKAYGLKIN